MSILFYHLQNEVFSFPFSFVRRYSPNELIKGSLGHMHRRRLIQLAGGEGRTALVAPDSGTAPDSAAAVAAVAAAAGLSPPLKQVENMRAYVDSAAWVLEHEGPLPPVFTAQAAQDISSELTLRSVPTNRSPSAETTKLKPHS